MNIEQAVIKNTDVKSIEQQPEKYAAKNLDWICMLDLELEVDWLVKNLPSDATIEADFQCIIGVRLIFSRVVNEFVIATICAESEIFRSYRVFWMFIF